MTQILFHIVEIDVRNPSANNFVETYRFSDHGYVSDTGVAYPPLVDNSFQIQRGLVISPISGQSSNTWGSLTLNNPGGTLNTLLSTRINDHMPVRIKYGFKTLDPNRNYYPVDPPLSSLQNAFVGLGTTFSLSQTQAVIALVDVSAQLSVASNVAVFSGTGQLNGDSGLTGQLKPRLRGTASKMTPILIDAANYVYQISDNPANDTAFPTAVYEGGYPNFGSPTNVTDIYDSSTAPSPGTVTYMNNASGLFIRLGTKPVYQITVDAAGPRANGGLIDVLKSTLIGDFGLSTSYIDAAWTTGQAMGMNYQGGWYWNGSASFTGLDAAAALLAGTGINLVPTRNGTLLPYALKAPSDYTTSPVIAINDDNMVSLSPVDMDSNLSPPTWRWRIGSNHNFTVFSQGSQLSPRVASNIQTQLSIADPPQTWTDVNVKGSYPVPNDPDIVPTAMNHAADALSRAQAFGALYGVQRRIWACQIPKALAYGVDLTSLVSLKSNAPGLTAGVLGVVVGETQNSNDQFATLQVLV